MGWSDKLRASGIIPFILSLLKEATIRPFDCFALRANGIGDVINESRSFDQHS
jgi:hypothetical protein